jgi:hypothetical protein
MAFKMRGFPKQSGVGGVKAEEDLASELKGGTKQMSKVKKNKPIDYDEAMYEIDHIKETANNAGRALTAAEKATIARLEAGPWL